MTRKGFTMIPNAVIEQAGLTPNELAVYVALSLHADQQTRKCYPGFARIGEVANVSRETVKRAVKVLEARGLVGVERRKVGGKNLHNVYVLPLQVGSERAYIGSESAHGWALREPRTRPSNKTHELSNVQRSALHESADDEEQSTAIESRRGRCSAAQLIYLHDLHVMREHVRPDAARVKSWRKLSTADAHDLIKELRKNVGRGDTYDGPDASEPAYELLSERGKQWADARMLPQEVTL